MESPSTPNETGLIEALLRHTDWARRLAASIVTDGASAEDAVQDAWVAALLHPPRHARNLRSWLSFLVRNAVRQGLRGESRRRSRERQAARPEGLPGAGDAIERAELHRRLVDAVLGLPESCRSVVVLAYFDDLSPNEIARQLGMPDSTVRSHLRRGLQRLREDLQAKRAVKDKDLLSSLAALAWPRARLAPTAIGSAGGLILMTTQTKLILAGTIIVLFGGWAWWRHDSSTSHSQEAERQEPDLVLAEKPQAQRTPQSAPESHREELGSAAGAASQPPGNPALGDLMVTVQWESDGSRAVGVGVQVRRPGDIQSLDRVEGETDSEGVFRLGGVRPGAAWIAADRGEEVETQIRPGERTEISIKLSTGVEVRGRVVDQEGKPVSGAGIWISWGDDSRTGRIAAFADATGGFHVRDLQQHQLIGARAPGHAPSSLRYVDRTSGTIETALVLPGRGGAVEGRVVDPDGTPIPAAHVEVNQLDPHPLRYEDTTWAAVQPCSGRSISDGNGEFRIADVASGSSAIVVRAKGHAWSRASIEIPEGGTARTDVTLSRGAILSGGVSDAKGLPLAKIPLWIVPPADSSRTIGSQPSECIGSSDEDGHFRIEGLPTGHTEILAERQALGRASTVLDLVEGIETTWDAVLSRGLEVSGHVVDQQGHGLGRWLVTARFAKSKGIQDEELKLLSWRGSCRSQSDGSFSIPNCLADVPLRIAVSSPEKLGQELAWIDDVKAGSQGLEVRVEAEAQPTAFILGTVLDASARPVSDAEVTAYRTLGGAASQNVRTDSVTGRFRLGPLPPGVYRVQVLASGQAKLEVPPSAISQGQELDLGVLRMQESGTVLVRLRPKDGASPGDVDLSVYGDGSTPIELLTITADVARSSRMPVGSYRLVVRENGHATQQVAFDISTDHESELSVKLSVVPR